MQRVSAGRYDQAPWAARQERADLLHIARVVKDDEDPLIGQHAPVQRGLVVYADWKLLGRNAEGLEEPAKRLGVPHRIAGVVEAAHVDVQLTVRETVADQVAQVIRERGLPDPSCSFDHDHHGAAAICNLICQASQGLELRHTAHEVLRGYRKLARPDRGNPRLLRVTRGHEGPAP